MTVVLVIASLVVSIRKLDADRFYKLNTQDGDSTFWVAAGRKVATIELPIERDSVGRTVLRWVSGVGLQRPRRIMDGCKQATAKPKLAAKVQERDDQDIMVPCDWSALTLPPLKQYIGN